MRILILGASGFIGTHLAYEATAKGHKVLALCRSGQVDGLDNRQVFSWQLGQDIPLTALENIDCAIHLAHDFSGQKGACLTQEATLACVAQLQAAKVGRQLFFSSYSAGAHAVSLYGRTKFAIEHALSRYIDIVIVRPGLVLGRGGVYGRIRKWSQRLPLIPLPDGGHAQVPVVTIERLGLETLKLIEIETPPTEANLFEPDFQSLRQLVLSAAREAGKKPWILPLPSRLMMAGLRVVSWLRVPLPVNADNLTGFLANQQAEHISTMQEKP